MRILTWNCNQAFRKKYQQILKFDPDICVIEECEDPGEYGAEYGDFARNYIWTGHNKNKSLGIFAKPGIKIEKQDWAMSDFLRHFLVVKVNDDFDLVGVWTKDGYIPTYAILQELNLEHYNDSLVLAGDFNSSQKFDKIYGGPHSNHSAVINKLAGFGLESVYHNYYHEAQGEESRATFYQFKKTDDGHKYHIDYIFCNRRRVKDFFIGDESWLQYSDHVPLYVDIDQRNDITQNLSAMPL